MLNDCWCYVQGLGKTLQCITLLWTLLVRFFSFSRAANSCDNEGGYMTRSVCVCVCVCVCVLAGLLTKLWTDFLWNACLNSVIRHARTCTHTHTHTHTILMAIFPGEPGLAGCPLNSPSPFILELHILLGQA